MDNNLTLNENSEYWVVINGYPKYFVSNFGRIMNIKKKRILKYPNRSKKQIAERAIYKIKPFKENGAGYRDTLLWETVLDILSSGMYENVLLITNDISDFYKKKKKKL